MNSPIELEEKENNFNTNIPSIKNSINKDIYINSSSKKKVITLNTNENLYNSPELRISSINKQKINYSNQKNFIMENNNNEYNEEEEEINSDEYVSSTNLDVETNTYINFQDNVKNEENKIKKKIIRFPGRLRSKILSDDINNKIEEIKQQKNNNIFLINDKEIINNNKNINIINHNDNNFNKANFNRKMNNKSDFIINKEISKDTENLKTIDPRILFTPTNEGKKKLKVLRELILKKLEERLKDKNIKINTHSQTISNNSKIIDNNIIKNYIRLNLNLNQNKSPKITVNNSITSNSIDKKSTSMNEFQQNIPLNNNNIDLSVYKRNILKNLGSLNINEQKYQFIPQSIKKTKTQGRVGKIIYNKINNRNNFLCINRNNQNKTNKTINSPISLNHNNKINRISPANNMNNSQNYNSICTNKINNFHSLKNLKIENVQKSIKKYLLGDEYFKMFPNSKEKNNKIEKDHHKIIKNSINNNIKNKTKNNNRSIKYNINKLNLNNYIIKKTIPLNINSQKNQLRSFNSYFPKKINNNAFNNNVNDNFLTTISNKHHNRKIDMFNNFKKYLGKVKNKNRNTPDKKNNNEKRINNKDELSYNILPENSKKNIISFKKIKHIKNKIYSSDLSNIEYQNNNKINNINHKKNKLQTKINLKNEENKKIKKFNTRNNMNKNNTENINTGTNNNNYSTYKKINYDYNNNNNLKDINFKTLPYKCLSPNFHNLKKIMEKSHPTKMKDIYKNKLSINNRGRNSYNNYLSSSIMENNNYKHMNNNNSSIFQNNSINSNSIIFIKKLQKENFRDKFSNRISNTLNYNIENISNFSTQNKKIIVFNNVNNYNINNTNNTLNNITNIKNEQQQNYRKENEDLNNYSSLINKNYYKNPKKIYINNSNVNCNNKYNKTLFTNKKEDSGNIRQNLIYLENSRSKNNCYTNNDILEMNKYQYNKNMINKLEKNDNLNINNINYPLNINNSNNKLINYSISNNKERNTINNNSYINIYLLKDKKNTNNKNKNMTIDTFEKIPKINYKTKSISPIQEIRK